MDYPTFTERKQTLLNDIRESRNNLTVYKTCYVKFGNCWKETIDLELTYFQSLLDELMKLKREGKKLGIQTPQN